MNDQLVNALLAVLAGSAIAALLVTPVAAVLYRRRGGMGLGSLLVLVSSAVYAVALWTYTLLPVPDPDEIRCAGTQLVPFATWDDIASRGVGSAEELLGNAAFLQVAFNVALFVPFGYFVRRVLRRGFVVTAVLAALTSLLIETTQRTGVWGIYDCAYRVFDVDDLITNTTGAVIGSLLSALFVSRTVRSRPLPDHVTLGRRWMGMALDALVTTVIAFTVNVSWRAFHLYGPGDERFLDGAAEQWLAWGTAGLVQLVVVLAAGRTIGEWAVAVRTQPRAGARFAWSAPLARLVKWFLGVGGYAALNAWAGPDRVLDVFLVLTLLAAWPGRDHPGLANSAAGLDLRVQLPDDGAPAPHQGHDDRSTP